MNDKTITYIADEATIAFAKQALEIQDACNLGAVARAFVRNLDAIRDSQYRDENGQVGRIGGDTQMKHPAVALFVDKLSHLAGTQGLGSGKAVDSYEPCRKLANGEDVTITIIPLEV